MFETEVVRESILDLATELTYTLQGNISRQEAVSMLPPLFLDVEPHHKVHCLPSGPPISLLTPSGHGYVRCPRIQGPLPFNHE